ncbi:MAG TPA: efflux transporter outer membrane subunit [Kofleriaceae bacterium]|jgi:multidrug efflux system outer membrane protein|nr:efflux transporter outer membrane subunit [Kofleriaceae bacterium]
MRRARFALALAAVLGGCTTMAPTYQRPAAPVPATLPGGSGTATAAALPWRAFVHEQRLQRIVDQSLAQSRDLRKAVLQIDLARAQYRIQRAQQLPSIDAVASVASSRAIIGPGNTTLTSTQYSAQVGLASWEIDVFGRLRSLSDAKLQSYLSTVELARAARISLIAETASAYLTLAADRSRLAIAQGTMTVAQQTMDLTEKLVTGGTSNRGDYWQAATVFQQARADVALLTAAIAQDRNALELLAGGKLDDGLLPDALPEQLDWFADVPVGLSSAVLLDRPDVLAAEHDLIAANADIGAARAAFFPSLTLTASGGLASAALSALFSGPAAVWTLAPALAVPLFRGGANRANLELAEAQHRQLVAGYELAIQTAFREVADALATRGTIDEQLAAQVALVDAANKGYELAQARYKAGVDTFLTTLVSQRALYAARNSLVATQLAALGSRVSLYRVLGGGVK